MLSLSPKFGHLLTPLALSANCARHIWKLGQDCKHCKLGITAVLTFRHVSLALSEWRHWIYSASLSQTSSPWQTVSVHVREVVLKWAQSLHVINVMCPHGMKDQELLAVFRSVVLAKLLYSSSDWWGFATTDDRHRIEAVVRRWVRAGLYPADGPSAAQLVDDYDNTLCSHIELQTKRAASKSSCHTIFFSPMTWTTVTLYPD